MAISSFKKKKKIKLRASQWCMLLPLSLSLYSEIILQTLGYPGIKVRDNVNNLRHAIDTVLTAANEEDLQQSSVIVEEDSKKNDLELNNKKIEVLVFIRNNVCPQIHIFIKQNTLKQRDQIKYLSTLRWKQQH